MTSIEVRKSLAIEAMDFIDAARDGLVVDISSVQDPVNVLADALEQVGRMDRFACASIASACDSGMNLVGEYCSRGTVGCLRVHDRVVASELRGALVKYIPVHAVRDAAGPDKYTNCGLWHLLRLIAEERT